MMMHLNLEIDSDHKMNKHGLENGGDRLLLIIGALLATFILLLAMHVESPTETARERFCMDSCQSQYRKVNTLHDISGVTQKNMHLTKCFKDCTQ